MLIPNGRATVQFCLAVAGYRHRPGEPAARNADVFLPVTSTSYVLSQRGRADYVGVQFTPTGASLLWPDPPRRPVALRRLADAPAKARLAEAPRRVLDEWLLALRNSSCPDAQTRRRALASRAAEIVDENAQDVDVGGLASSLSVSTATLYRAFVAEVGVGTKAYISIRRFHRFMSSIFADAQGDTMASLAAATGYADESHAAREVRRHAGVSARQLREGLDGITRLMVGAAGAPGREGG